MGLGAGYSNILAFSLVVFKVTWGSFGALGDCSHDYLMSLVYGISPTYRNCSPKGCGYWYIIWKVWLLGPWCACRCKFPAWVAKAYEYKNRINFGKDGH